jgi:hypothetical protein
VMACEARVHLSSRVVVGSWLAPDWKGSSLEGSRLECSAVLSVQESGDAKERCSIAGGVEAWSRKARLKKRLLGRLMAVYTPFCGVASAFIDSDAARDGRNATTVASMRSVWHKNLVLWPTVIRSGAAVHDPGK